MLWLVIWISHRFSHLQWHSIQIHIDYCRRICIKQQDWKAKKRTTEKEEKNCKSKRLVVCMWERNMKPKMLYQHTICHCNWFKINIETHTPFHPIRYIVFSLSHIICLHIYMYIVYLLLYSFKPYHIFPLLSIALNIIAFIQ